MDSLQSWTQQPVIETEHLAVYAGHSQEETARHYARLGEMAFGAICAGFGIWSQPKEGSFESCPQSKEGSFESRPQSDEERFGIRHQPNGEKIRVYICSSVRDYLRETGKREEDYENWMIGFSDMKAGKIVLLVNLGQTSELDKIAAHELVHIILDRWCNGAEQEVWLAEGIALLCAGQINIDFVREDECPRLDELGGVCAGGETPDEFVANGGYDYAGIYVWYFLEKFGEERFLAAYKNELELSGLLWEGFEREAVAEYRKAHCYRQQACELRRLDTEKPGVLKRLFDYRDMDADEEIRKAVCEITAGNMDIFLLWHGDEPLGELRVNYRSEDDREAVFGRRAYLNAYRIRKEYRGQGFGNVLMRGVLEELSVQGYTEFTIGVEDDNEIAKHIYERFGFRQAIARKREIYGSEDYEYDLLLKREPNEKVKHILQQIKLGCSLIFPRKLVGVYVHGSIAFGCFGWEGSDIDFLVMTSSEPNLEEKKALIRWLLELDADCPPKGLEMSVVQKEYCGSFIYPTPYDLHFSNYHKEKLLETGEAGKPRIREDALAKYCQEMHGTDKDLAAHFTVVREVGFALCGGEPKDVFGKVPKEVYLDSLWYDIGSAADDIIDNPVYVILNLCRVLAFVEGGRVLSKEQGGAWAKERFDFQQDGIGMKHAQTPDRQEDREKKQVWLRLIAQAAECYRTGKPFPTAHTPEQKEELVSFAEAMLDLIRAAGKKNEREAALEPTGITVYYAETEEQLKPALDLCFRILGQQPEEGIYGYQAWKERMDAGHSRLLVCAKQGDSVIAAVLGRPESEESLVCGMVACDERFRGRGITKGLMERFAANARAAGFRYITLGADAQAEGFYEKCGYRVIMELHGQKIYQLMLI